MIRVPVLFAVFLLAVPAQAAERVKAEVACQPAGEKLVYDCDIRLFAAGSGAPVEGVEIVVGADMPSMPMAHSVAPAKAEPAGEPGLYRVRLHLEMTGEWALKLRLSGPMRDQLVEVVAFE